MPALTRAVAVTVVTSIAVGVAGTAHAAGPQPPSPVVENALTAMHGEAFAHASYLAYGEWAADTGEREVARLFRQTARVERYDHFAAEARLINFVGGNADNLRAAIAGEEEEATITYPAYAEQARRDGCAEAAELFTELAGDEAVHARRFRQALEAILNPGSGKTIPVGVAVPPVPIPASLPACSGQTQDNLEATMRGEAFANARYTSYAERARRTGLPRLPRLFENTAGQEFGEHFSEAAYLAGLVRGNAENLRTSFDGEVYEATVMYPRFSREAAAVGARRAAALFAEIAHDEADHASAFLGALVDLGV